MSNSTRIENLVSEIIESLQEAGKQCADAAGTKQEFAFDAADWASAVLSCYDADSDTEEYSIAANALENAARQYIQEDSQTGVRHAAEALDAAIEAAIEVSRG